ncbi:uncharacterized protein LOC129902954 isoform X1 [Solanum dulcamara]|uniref:uncharacterized protein LOC129902954 isoform X1 n=1 Tax=Solanum dulcamara TaxID=45834 RepID=UPI00248646FB|nr:uncharacterized protein LOC129902954 isoform X1 [Solanum dulcamara]
MSMPLDQAKERAIQLESEITSLERFIRVKISNDVADSVFSLAMTQRLILASGVEGMEGFRQRWSLHGRVTDTKRRLEALKGGMENRKKDETAESISTNKK